MSSVFLLHFDAPVNATHPARHYLEYTARTVERRIADHTSGALYRTVPIMYALFERGIGFTVARVWPNATKRDERLLRDLHNNPRLCPICNPALGLRTVCYRRTTEPDDATGEIHTLRYWRTLGKRSAYGNLPSIRFRDVRRRARQRIRRDGTPNFINPPTIDDPVIGRFIAVPYVEIDGRRYDIDVIADATNDIAAARDDLGAIEIDSPDCPIGGLTLGDLDIPF